MSGIQDKTTLQFAHDVNPHIGIKRKSSAGKRNHNWSGGRRYFQGYIMRYAPNHPNACNRYVLEHRIIMEQHLGRILKTNEVVHHKNHKKSDNRIENLELMDSKVHAHMHGVEDGGIEPILNSEIAHKILDEYKSTDINVIPLAKKYRISRVTILDVLHGKGAYHWVKNPIKNRLPVRRKRSTSNYFNKGHKRKTTS